MTENGIFQRFSGKPDPHAGTALEQFFTSMNIGFYEWHEGIGYNIDALKELSSDEIKTVEKLLISRKDEDWRDVEALAALRTEATIQALKDCLDSPNLDCRLFAVRYLKEMGIEDHVEDVVIRTLPETRVGEGMTYALNLARDYPTDRVRNTVLRCALHGNDSIRVHCAALALLLHGKARTEAKSYQGIVYEFNNKDMHARINSFKRLCQIINVTPEDIL